MKRRDWFRPYVVDLHRNENVHPPRSLGGDRGEELASRRCPAERVEFVVIRREGNTFDRAASSWRTRMRAIRASGENRNKQTSWRIQGGHFPEDEGFENARFFPRMGRGEPNFENGEKWRRLSRRFYR